MYRASLSLLLIFLLAGLARSQSNGVIRGQILVPSVRISERIQVILQRSDGPIVSRSFSDSLGNYEFRGLPAGTYDVIVNLEGYGEARQSVGLGTGLAGTQIVNIVLTEKEREANDSSSSESDVVDITELGRKYPRKVLDEYEKAREDNRKGNTAKAGERLEAIVKAAPDFFAAHNTLGTIYQKMDRYRDAEREYNSARQLNPRSSQPLENLGSLYIQEADASRKSNSSNVGKLLDNGLDILDEAKKLNPRSVTAHYLLGMANYRSEFYEEAEQSFKRALELDGRMPGARLMLANLYIKLKKWENALQQLDTWLADNPKAVERAQILETRGKVADRLRGKP
ncbi:MAG TPA: tetratricopeptide repeat protein [Terriglobia bacterium]|nr:tetratricopeptide repeat protein [Terriglobia bacterium]